MEIHVKEFSWFSGWKKLKRYEGETVGCFTQGNKALETLFNWKSGKKRVEKLLFWMQEMI